MAKVKVENKITPNWMSTVDSPTYRWTLYLVSAEVWNNPNLLHNDDTSARNTNKAVIVAKQGVTTEFSLDNFMAISIVTPGLSHGNTTPGIIQFDIFENLGFTFLDKALRAGKALGNAGNLHSQNWILKLEFLGRDPLTGGSSPFNGIFFYPVKLNQIRSSTGPEGTRYNVVAWSMIKHTLTEVGSDIDIKIKNIDTVQSFATNLEKAYNDSEESLISLSQLQRGVKPARRIKVIFGDSSHKRGIKGVGDFMLAAKPWVGTADAGTSGGQATQINNSIDQVIETNKYRKKFNDQNLNDVELGANDAAGLKEAIVNRESNLPIWMAQLIQKNVPAWPAFVKECQTVGQTPAIVVTPSSNYVLPSDPEIQALIGNIAPIEVTFTIKILMSDVAPSVPVELHNSQYTDKKYQNDKIDRLPILKTYSFLYSGINTEVLNYQIDIENLYTVVNSPILGMYHADKKQQFAPTHPIKVTQVDSGDAAVTTAGAGVTTSPTAKYLEDTPYDPSADFNNLVKSNTKPPSSEEQQVEETDGGDSISASVISEMAKREYDSYNFTMEIKGDPYWMGNMQAVVQGKLEIPDYDSEEALILFIQYNPNADDLIEKQTKGPIDVVSTGIYKITSIESRFQGGKFTQTLTGFKDPTTNTYIVLPKLVQLSMGK